MYPMIDHSFYLITDPSQDLKRNRTRWNAGTRLVGHKMTRQSGMLNNKLDFVFWSLNMIEYDNFHKENLLSALSMMVILCLRTLHTTKRLTLPITASNCWSVSSWARPSSPVPLNRARQPPRHSSVAVTFTSWLAELEVILCNRKCDRETGIHFETFTFRAFGRPP